jgi:hypothetical protein
MDKRTPTTTNLTDAQRIDWLRLIRSDRVGPHGIMEQTPRGPKMGRYPHEAASRDDLFGRGGVCHFQSAAELRYLRPDYDPKSAVRQIAICFTERRL